MSCIIVTLHVPVYCVTKKPLFDCINQISKYTMCTCCGKPAGLFSHMLFDIERELFLLQLSRDNCNRNNSLSISNSICENNPAGLPQHVHIGRKFSVCKRKSPSRLSTNYRNTAFRLLEAGTRVADVPRSF